MTLNQLHKQLAKLIAAGHGRNRVSISKTSFQDSRESDGCTILPVAVVDVDWIVDADGDGGRATNKDGTERGRWTVILGGCSYDPSKGASNER
jgi:hypothetical protein